MTDVADHTAFFVTTAWLAERLGDPSIQVIDGSFYLANQGRDAAREFRDGHVPGAIFFDIDAVADRSSALPHMLPDAAAFAEAAGALGIGSGTTLVVYDGLGLFAAPRVWWTLRVFGAFRVLILEGGLPRWRAEGRPVESGDAKAAPAIFAAKNDLASIADLAAVRAALDNDRAVVIDARPAPRFRGEMPEPRPGLRSGHMPGSYNVPFNDLVADGSLKAPDELRQAFAVAGVDLSRPVITSCGSGVSAAILVLALARLGKTDVALYDGSWAEYGARTDVPVTTGPAT